MFNLRGNQRTAGELSRKEGGKVFGAGSRNTVAIFIGLKNPAHAGPCEISYRDIGDYLTREEKLRIIADANLSSINWTDIIPNSHGDWIGQRDDTFATWPAIGAKKREPGQVTIFQTYSSGLKSGRDAWCYNYSREKLGHNIDNLLDQYRTVKSEFEQPNLGGAKLTDKHLTQYLEDNPRHTAEGKISWNRSLKQQVIRGTHLEWNDGFVFQSTYRPFSPQWTYFDRRVNDMVYQLRSMFPSPHHANVGFYVVGAGSDKPFSVLMTDSLPDLALWGSSSGQYFPRCTYEEVGTTDGGLDFADHAEVDEYGYRRVDNITDEILAIYRQAAGPQVSKDDIFRKTAAGRRRKGGCARL